MQVDPNFRLPVALFYVVLFFFGSKQFLNSRKNFLFELKKKLECRQLERLLYCAVPRAVFWKTVLVPYGSMSFDALGDLMSRK